MSYEPTVWKSGDIVTAEKLNNIEDEVDTLSKEEKIPEFSVSDADKVLTVKVVDSTPTLEWEEAGGGLPSYATADKDKSLFVNHAGNGVEWRKGIPYYENTYTYKNTFLNCDNSGVLKWTKGTFSSSVVFYADSRNDGSNNSTLYDSPLMTSATAFVTANNAYTNIANVVEVSDGNPAYDANGFIPPLRVISCQYIYDSGTNKIAIAFICIRPDGSIHKYVSAYGSIGA